MANTLVKRQQVKDVIEGEDLSFARESAGLSQSELCERVAELSGFRISQGQISRWERCFEFEVWPVISAALNKILL